LPAPRLRDRLKKRFILKYGLGFILLDTTDAEMQAFVVGFAILRHGRAQETSRVGAHFVPNLEVV
jgi:hypothetical protein